MSGPTGRESDKFMLRLPDGMRDRIKRAADSNNRSMNAEIVATLEDKYPPPTPGPDDLLDRLEKTAQALPGPERAEQVEILNRWLAASSVPLCVEQDEDEQFLRVFPKP